MQATLFNSTRCTLGEAPLWTHDRLYWVDIAEKRLHSCDADGRNTQSWQFDEHVTATATLADGALLLASETGLWRFTPADGERTRIASLEADTPGNRSNDGRADPQGGFWISTMSKAMEPGKGALYRYYRGEIRRLRTGFTVPNGLCFAPDGRRGYFTDTREGNIRSWSLDAEGWPNGPEEIYTDLRDAEGPADGIVVDSKGALWAALSGGSRVIRLRADGGRDGEIPLPVSRPSCPAFGPDLRMLLITTISEGLDAAALAREPLAGCVFAAPIGVAGLPPPVVRLG